MSFKPEEIKRVVEAEDDFGHEMRVGNILRQACSATIDPFCQAQVEAPQHGGTYIDPVTAKPRQFDYRARIQYFEGGTSKSQKSILLAVECKNLHESSPLIVCGRERTDQEAYHTFVESRCDEFRIEQDPLIRKVEGRNSLYPPYLFVGKSLLRLKTDSNKKLKVDPQPDLYDRWSQALASCAEHADSSCSFAKVYSCPQVRTFIIPIVVVPDALLWSMAYNNTGAIHKDPEPVEECEFFVAAPLHVWAGQRTLILTHVHFVTLKGLADLLMRFLQKPIRKLDTLFPPYSTVLE